MMMKRAMTRKNRFSYPCICIFLFLGIGCQSVKKAVKEEKNELRIVEVEPGGQDSNLVKTAWPSIGCWFWSAEEFKPQGFRRFIDLYEKHTSFGLLSTSLRFPGELTDIKMHDQVKAASEYARQRGMGVVMDLDLRLAREQFRERYPGEQQQLLLLREFPLKSSGTAGITVKSPSYGDHYTYGRSEYAPLKTELLRMYCYKKEGGVIDPSSITDISNRKKEKGNKDSLIVTINCAAGDDGLTACVLVAVTLFTPDVFAPHLLLYQREILQQYKDASLAGACKDEWGFPGRFSAATNDLWYSSFMAHAYAKKRPGQELLRDMLLMAFGEKGRDAQRHAAINYYMEMYWQRNSEIETDYYYAIKEYFGKEAMSATHPTWYPFPDEREIFKNGLSWWNSKRDLAQTDESTPFSVRTALAKKMHSPVWYNMYYEGSLKEYQEDLWISVLGGGRLNYHPVWPDDMKNLTTSLFRDSLLIAESRVNMLNYISKAPVDCPVAVVFGHASALNFSDKKGFADVGLSVTDALWKEGYYADLIPSSEILDGSLHVNQEGKVQYGSQQYEAVVLYNPEYERREISGFFMKAAAKAKTGIFSIGSWTFDFEGNPLAGKNFLPASMQQSQNSAQVVQSIISSLKDRGIAIQTKGEMRSNSGFPKSVMPKTRGSIRLTDGSVIQASGENNVMGDPIRSTIKIGDKAVRFDAIGLAAIRLDKQGEVEALAAGGLKSVKAGSFSITLEKRADIVLIKEKGKWKGIIKGSTGEIPASLTTITSNWTRVRWPVAYP